MRSVLFGTILLVFIAAPTPAAAQVEPDPAGSGEFGPWSGPNTDLPKHLAFQKGALSLVEFPGARMDGSTSIFLINDTTDPIPGAVWEPVEPWQEVRDRTTWKRTERASLGCGTIPPPEALRAGHFIRFRVRDPMSGDVAGKIRYCIDAGSGRPLSTSAIDGRFSSKLFDQAGQAVSEFEIGVESDFRYGVKGDWNFCSIAKSPEQLIALLDLVRNSGEFNRLRQALSAWVENGRDPRSEVNPEEFNRAIKKLAASTWGDGPDEQALFRNAYSALQQDAPARSLDYGAPSKFREVAWSALGAIRGSIHLGGINPERYDQLHVISQSNNPWGASEPEIAKLLSIAEGDLTSESKEVRNSAAEFLTGSWLKQETYPTDRYRALLRSTSPEGRKSGVIGLIGRKNRNEAVEWVQENFLSLGEHLFLVWNRLQSDDGLLEEWEISVVEHLLETRPLSTISSLHGRYALNSRNPKMNLPIRLRKPIRAMLIHEAHDNRVTGPQPDSLGTERRRVWIVSAENSPEILATARVVLAHWNNEDDTDLIRAFLDHPGASYTPETKTTERKRYVVRKASARLLEARNQIVSEDVVFEEIVPLLPVERE